MGLKINFASNSNQETQVYELLASNTRDKPVANLLNQFIHRGPNGEHLCLVFELLGPSVSDVLWDYRNPLCRNGGYRNRRYPLHLARRILRGAALSLTTLHSNGIVYGDIHLKNILFTLRPDMENIPVEELKQTASEDTELKPLDPNDVGGYPRLLFEPKPLYEYAHIEEDRVPLIKAADLGSGEAQSTRLPTH